MKLKLIFLISIFCSVTLFSQKKTPIINPKKMVQLIEFDADKVIVKLKIKETNKQEKVRKIISSYNIALKEIETKNQKTFDGIVVLFRDKIAEAKLKKDGTIFKKAKIKIIKLLLPIRKEVVSQKKKLNVSLKEILSGKQYNKWIKYKQNKIKSSKSKRK